MLRDKFNKYYADSKKEFEKLISTSKYNIKLYRNNNVDLIDLFIGEKKILTADYEIIGYYNLINSMWRWGWSNPFVEKNLVTSETIIKNINDTIYKSSELTDKEREIYLYFLNNPSFYIEKDNLDELLKMTFFYTKGKWFITRKNKNKRIENSSSLPTELEFILIKNITQLT